MNILKKILGILILLSVLPALMVSIAFENGDNRILLPYLSGLAAEGMIIGVALLLVFGVKLIKGDKL